MTKTGITPQGGLVQMPGAYRWRRPKRAVLIVYLAGMAVLLALGSWQMQRLAWKEQLLENIAAQQQQPRAFLSSGEDLRSMAAWQLVALRGVVAAPSLALGPRTYQGAAGVHVVTPLRLPDGAIVFINRGWVSHLGQDKDVAVGDRLSFEGVVRLPERGWMTPENAPEKEAWYWPDLAAMAQVSFGGDATRVLVTAYIQATAEKNEREGLVSSYRPHPVALTVEGIRNDHAQYALFWFVMAGLLTVFAVLAHRPEK